MPLTASGRKTAPSHPALNAAQTNDQRFSYMTNAPFCVSVVCYALNRFLILGVWQRPEAFWRGHFNDLFLVPCALPPLLLVLRRLGLRSHDDPPNGREVLFHLALWSGLFEIVGPRLGKGTGDVWDVLSYAGGGLLAWLWWNRPRRQNVAQDADYGEAAMGSDPQS